MPHWDLEGDVRLSIPVSIPVDPYSDSSKTTTAKYSAGDLRALFVEAIWRPRLKPIIATAFKRAAEELQGAPISVVPMSGGSANIGWLRELIKSKFESELSHADILSLPDFQEVVAKGLAVECARRFVSDHGGFWLGDLQSPVSCCRRRRWRP